MQKAMLDVNNISLRFRLNVMHDVLRRLEEWKRQK